MNLDTLSSGLLRSAPTVIGIVFHLSDLALCFVYDKPLLDLDQGTLLSRTAACARVLPGRLRPSSVVAHGTGWHNGASGRDGRDNPIGATGFLP